MIGSGQLVLVIFAMTLLSAVLTFLASSEISERHHLHHDTYAISQVMPRTIMLVMVFMGVLGGLTGWLCHLGVFSQDPEVPLAFFCAFQLTLLVVLFAVCSVQVMAYDDRMFVRRWNGRQREIIYADIKAITRKPMLFVPHFNSLRIETNSGTTVYVSGLLDVEQMLVRIDRYDVLKG